MSYHDLKAMNVPSELEGVIVSDPEILGGRPCFRGTRVPFETFLDYIESGFSLDRFLEGFPSVERNQAVAVLEWQSRQSRRAVGLASRFFSMRTSTSRSLRPYKSTTFSM